MEHSYKKRVIKEATKGKLDGLLESFMTIYGKKRGTIYEGGCYNRSKSTRAINLLQSFMAILGKQIRGLCTRGYMQRMTWFRRVCQ